MKYKKIVKGKKPFTGRVYRTQEGSYISVTSIINPEGIPFPEELLVQYASRGTIVHKQVEHFLRHYQYVCPTKLCKQDLIDNVLEGTLNLHWEDCDFRGFLNEYGNDIEFIKVEQRLKNDKHKYAGTADGIVLYKGDLAIVDWKTSSKYTGKKMIDYWKQQAAYAKCIKENVKKMIILPLNPKSKKGYDAPIVETDINHYFNLFLEDLEFVKNNYILPK